MVLLSETVTPTAMQAITTALTTAITTLATDALGGIAAIVPVAAPVFGGMILIGVALNATKKFTGR